MTAAIFPVRVVETMAAGDLGCALERAGLALGRLDEALTAHPLAAAWRHWSRLGAAVRHAAVDGIAVDPLRFAAMLEGLRLPVERDLPAAERGAEHRALLHTLDLFLLLRAADSSPADPEFADPELADPVGSPRAERRAMVAAARAHFCSRPAAGSTLAAAGLGLISGIEAGHPRGALRAALPRFLQDAGLVRSLLPGVTGTAALNVAADGPEDRSRWLARFLAALADDAERDRAALRTRTSFWQQAQRTLTSPRASRGRRRLRTDALLPRALDLLAAQPFLGPAGLARTLDCSTRAASRLLHTLAAQGLAVEVTGRASHKLFALACDPGQMPLTAGPRRAEQRNRSHPPPGAAATDRTGQAPGDPAPVAKHLPAGPPRPPLDIDLSALCLETDRSVERVRAVLARLTGVA